MPGLEPQAEPVLEPYKRQTLDGLHLQRETPQGLVMHCLSHRTACIIEAHRGASERLTRELGQDSQRTLERTHRETWDGLARTLGGTHKGAWERVTGELERD